MGILANENAITSGGYQISNSLRFQGASSTYLARTPASAGNRQIFTFSFWAKRGALSTSQEMYFVNSGGGNFAQISWAAGNGFTVASVDASIAICELITTPVYRDPSAWYHLVVSVDTTQVTASNRVKLYVNGSQVTAFATATYPILNYNFQLNNTTAQNIGRPSTGTFDGYLAEYHFINGQALTPSSFGSTDTTSGQWVAKKYTGTYGTNGFYLPFSNGTSTTTLGADSSGNSNNWTLTNFTRSAGTSDCWMKDVPSGNGSAGTQPNSNYSTFNPLFTPSPNVPIAANLTINGNNYSLNTIRFPSSGLYYVEAYVVNYVAASQIQIGFGIPGGTGWTSDNTWYQNGTVYKNGASQGVIGQTYTTGDQLSIALDTTNSTAYFYKNNTLSHTLTGITNISSCHFLCYCSVNNTTVGWNFGQRSFAYTPPSGYVALCTANLPVATIKQGNKFMDATLWTGNGATRSITNTASFQPDLVWVKDRSSGTFWNVLFDSVRGAGNQLTSNGTDAELASASNVAGKVSAFNSNGFSVAAGSSSIFSVNGSSDSYVGWQWQAGQGSTSSNTNGSITSTTSVSATAGFSVVTYTGTGVAGATIGHGLGVTPKMFIVKNRTSGIDDWTVYHASLGNTTRIRLNSTAAANANILFWNNTSPTSSVFTVGADGGANGVAQSHVAYCFAEIAGFSKFGSYTGNGSTDGVFNYLGFRPKFVMIKLTSGAGSGWYMMDTSRDTYNVEQLILLANSSAAEATQATLDGLSNGFKIRTTSGDVNTNGATYIYAAFAENPFQNSNAR